MYICCSHTRVKHHLIPAKWGLGSYMPMRVRVWGFSARVHVLTCLQEPECFPSPELLQSKDFSASWEKNQREPASGYSKFFSEHVLARLSCLLILNFWWFARSRASVFEREVFPRAQILFLPTSPPSILCREDGGLSWASVKYLAHLYDFSFRGHQTLWKYNWTQLSVLQLRSGYFLGRNSLVLVD